LIESSSKSLLRKPSWPLRGSVGEARDLRNCGWLICPFISVKYVVKNLFEFENLEIQTNFKVQNLKSTFYISENSKFSIFQNLKN